MNTARSHTTSTNPSFSTVLKTVESYEFFEQAIALCDDLNKHYNLSGDDRRTVIEIMIRFRRLYNTMNTPNYFDHTKLSPESIKKYSDNYAYVFNLKECSRLIELPLVDRLPDKVRELSYTPHPAQKRKESTTGKVLQFPKISSPHASKNYDSNSRIQSNKDTLQRILKAQFDDKGRLKPNDIIKKERQKLLERIDPTLHDLYLHDIEAANDVYYFHNPIDNDSLQVFKKGAIEKKDGELIQAIKNNLIKHAANDDIFDPNTCRSLMLAEHIKNLTPENPITVNTVEFGICNITSVKTFDYGDECYYEICMVGENGGKSYLRIRANAFIVGDLSNKIIGKMNDNGKWLNTALPCTIRNIRSTLPQKKPESTSFKDRTTNFFKKGFGGIKNMFNFGKNS